MMNYAIRDRGTSRNAAQGERVLDRSTLFPGQRREAINFCSQCGSRLTFRWLEAEQRHRHVCSACHRVYYENPRVLVWCYIHWRDSLVFCRRAQPPARGLWSPPAGFVETGETLEEAAVREVGEETGIRLEPKGLELFRVASLPHMNEVYVEYRAELAEEPVFAPGPEALEVALFSAANVPRAELAFSDMLPAYPDEFFRCLHERDFPVRSIPVRPFASGKT